MGDDRCVRQLRRAVVSAQSSSVGRREHRSLPQRMRVPAPACGCLRTVVERGSQRASTSSAGHGPLVCRLSVVCPPFHLKKTKSFTHSLIHSFVHSLTLSVT